MQHLAEDKNLIEKHLSEIAGETGKLTNIKTVSGGSINNSYYFTFVRKKYFLKCNSKSPFPGMFAGEFKGLKELAKCNLPLVPLPYIIFESETSQYIIMDYKERKAEDDAFFEELGKNLAVIHRIKSTHFGFDESNYIGSLPQNNSKKENWDQFFIENRLTDLVKWSYDNAFFDKSNLNSFDNLYTHLKSIFPAGEPALLHGDLWSGNKMNTSAGPLIFDPAVYYGHREMDIAMTTLFSGFEKSFYKAYMQSYPLENGYQERLDICNLYPLLVHLKLFGKSYINDILRIIKKF